MKVPRFAGAGLILLSLVLMFLKDWVSFVVLAIAGIVLLFLPRKLSVESWKDFRSFDTPSFLKCCLVEVVFWLLLFFVLMGSKSLMDSAAASLGDASDLGSLDDVSVLQQNVAAMQKFLWSFVGLFLLTIIVWFLFYTVSRYVIWRIITKKKLLFRKFLLFNLVWWLVWLPLLAIILVGLRPGAVPSLAIAFTLLYAYFTVLVHYSFFKFRKLGLSFGKSIVAGFSRFQRFIIPILYMFAVFVILFQLLRFTSGWVDSLVSFIFIVLFLCWSRLYFAHMIKKYDVV